eukprot:gene3318-3803_t
MYREFGIIVSILATLHIALQAPMRTPDNRYMAVTVCRGGRRTIACPELELLHVFTAFYGKMSGHDCDSPVSSTRTQIPTCSSKNAAQIIRGECHGQQSCDLYGEDSLYDDPCPGVLKYLFVSYTCQGKSNVLGQLRSIEETIAKMPTEMTPIGQLAAPRVFEPKQEPDIKTLAVCSGKTGNIVCPDLKIIRVHGAFYGKQTERDCLGRLTRDSIPTCFAPYAISTVRDTCQGQQSCDLYTEPGLYGRSTCGKKEDKYLSVSYSCVGHSKVQEQLQFIKERAKQGWPITNPPAWTPSAYNTPQQSNLYGQQPQAQYQQQAASRSNLFNTYPYNRNILRPQSTLYQQPASRQMMPQQIPYQLAPAQYNPSMNQQFNGYNPFAQSPSCDMCNGDCNDWSCYGCGGCQTPQAVQQTYMYPYQRQDAAFHDGFIGHEMALSGMVLWPVPKLPKALRKLNHPKARSQTYEEEADDTASGSGSGDDEDDEDDTR